MWLFLIGKKKKKVGFFFSLFFEEKNQRKQKTFPHRQLLRKPLERAQPPVPQQPRQVPVQDHPLRGPRRRVVEGNLLCRADESGVRRAERARQRGLLGRHRRQRWAEPPQGRGRQKVVAVQSQLSFIAHDPSEGAREKNDIEQGLESVRVELGDARTELLDVLSDPLVCSSEPAQDARRIVGAVVGVGSVKVARQPPLERQRDFFLEELEARVDRGGRDSDAGKGDEAAAKQAKVLRDEVPPRPGLDAADLVSEQRAGDEEEALESDEARLGGEERGDAAEV